MKTRDRRNAKAKLHLRYAVMEMFGVEPPPVERDDEFFRRVDASQPTAEQAAQANDRAALIGQINRPSEMDRATWGRS